MRRPPLLIATMIAGGALACRQPPRSPALANALATAPAPARDLRAVGVPPWARLDGVWGVFPITHGSIEMAAFAGDNRLVTLEENDGSLRVWDIRARAAIAAFDSCPPPPDLPAQAFFNDYNRYTLAVSPDGRLAAVAHGKGTVCVRRLDDGTIEGNFSIGTTGLRTVSFWGSTRLVGYHQHTAPGPSNVVPPCLPNCSQAPPDGFIGVWDVTTGKQVAELQVGDLPGDELGRPALTTSLDGGRLVVPRGNEISLLESRDDETDLVEPARRADLANAALVGRPGGRRRAPDRRRRRAAHQSIRARRRARAEERGRATVRAGGGRPAGARRGRA